MGRKGQAYGTLGHAIESLGGGKGSNAGESSDGELHDGLIDVLNGR